MYQVHKDFSEYRTVEKERLEEILDSRVLILDGLDAPIIIRKIELLHSHGAYLVRTTAQDGSQGISVANDRMEFCHPLLVKLIAPYFIGKDARRLEELLDQVFIYKNNYKMAGIPYFSCLSALELSILDLLARARGVCLGEMFGKRINHSANVYVSSGTRGNTAEDELESIRARVDACGARAIKFKIGGRMSKNKDSLAGRSENLIYGARKFFGDDMIIHADGNGSYDAETAIRWGNILEDINAYFYEEPCPFDDLEATKEVTQNVKIPLAFGEQETSMHRFEWLVFNHGCDVIQPDILYNGGLIRTTKVARMAQLAGMTVTPHVSTGFCFVYILHLTSYTPNIGRYQEMKEGLEMTNDFLENQITLKDGSMNIPNSVGIGIRLDHPLLKSALVLADIH